MKKYKYLVSGLLVSAFLLTGCSDSFLDVKSPTEESADEYFTTDGHIQEEVVAAYDPLHWPDWAMGQYNPVNMMSDMMADDIWVGGQDKTDNQYWHFMMNYQAIPTNCMTGLWTVAYSGVKRSNDVLNYVSHSRANLTEKNATYYEAQARVLRVFYYNWLWKFWGNIPYYETNLTYPYLAKQYSADEVYQHIITDLEGAIALDAFPMKETSSNYGRVTKAMAYMLYTEIVMYQNDETRYKTALEYMEDIIGSGQYSLTENYADIFKESGEWNDESIFEINYKSKNAARTWDKPLIAGGTVLPRLISPKDWSDGTDGHLNGWGFCPVRTETYNRYANNDTRRNATCWDAAKAGKYSPRYQDTGFFLEKYTAKEGGDEGQIGSPDLNFNNNLRIYRFSETLLNAAELIVRGAGGGNAYEYLNRVHKRAGLTNEVAATIDNIIEERHLEFVGEGKRYWDLVRSGKASTVLIPDIYGYRTNTWTANKKYLPIPQSEIDAAQGTLIQNNY